MQAPALNSIPNPTDEELAGLVAAGEREAFALLVGRHLKRAHALAQRITGKPQEAEDIAQEALLRVWIHAGDWSEQKGRFSTWFYRIVTNLCIDHLRRHSREMAEIDPEWADAAPGMAAQLHRQQLGGRVAAEVSRLPPRQKTVLALCYYEGFSNAEAAAILDTTTGAVEALLVRARRKLHERLAAYSST